jgi:hypothetical protein
VHGFVAVRGLKKTLLRGVLGLVAIATAYLTLLVAPDPLFAYEERGRFIEVHSDEALPPEARDVIAIAEARVERSPLFDASREHHVYVCNTRWRWSLFSRWDSGAGAIAMAPIGRSVFTREARFERDRLVSASGREPDPPRTLAYYLAHEVTHTMTADRLGSAYFELPVWVREGYADYVGRGETFDYDETRARWLAGDRELDPEASGFYLRYVLLVAHLLDREGWSVERLLAAPPERDSVEARVLNGESALDP